MGTLERISLSLLIYLLLLPSVIGALVSTSSTSRCDIIGDKENHSLAYETSNAALSGAIEPNKTCGSFQKNPTTAIDGGHQMRQLSSNSTSASFARHIMCKDHDAFTYDPIEPTTIFRPTDEKAECLTTVSINYTIEFRWYYRSNSSKTWISCYSWSANVSTTGEYHYAGYLSIAGYWPGSYYPRAYRVDVYLDSNFSFSEFFEITNGGLNSPRMCENIDENMNPVNMKSRFTIGVDTKAFHYLKFDNIACFNEELGCCHNFTTVWIQPNGSTYKTHSGNFTDYKDKNVNCTYWKYGYSPNDCISINSSTPIGNWKVEVYLDFYYSNNTWVPYGPIAATPFIVGSEPVADWIFMAYLDGDNSLENASIDIFLDMALIGSSSSVNIVAQMDRIPGRDNRYGDWTDCKRFYITKDMTPTSGNATLDVLGEADMGDPNTLKNFVSWAMSDYPANYYCLVLWNHGAGYMGVCFDETNASDSLSLPELSQALSGFPAIIDIVLTDACSMSMVEVAYQIKDYANVLVGPEGLGYGPPPYKQYLSALTNNPSILPNAFARGIVTDYMNWCNPISQIRNATISATDLTKIVSLTTTLDDFALKLKEKETRYHEKICLARNLTVGFEGPYGGESGYFIDIYHFAQLVHQYILDEEVRNVADQIMMALSPNNTVIIEANKAHPNSHGLSMFFPDRKEKYFEPSSDSYGSVYEKTDLAIDTLWDEFVRHYLSGYVITILMPHSGVQAKVGEDLYVSDADGKIQVFVLPGWYSVNVNTTIVTGLGSREVFTQWSDGSKADPRTLLVSRAITLEAEYEIQYYLTVTSLYGSPTVTSGWFRSGESIIISVTSPVSGPAGTRYIYTWWNGTGSIPTSGINTTVTLTIYNPSSITWNWKIQYRLEWGTNPVGLNPVPNVSPSGPWYDSGTLVDCTAQEIDGYVFDHWTLDGASCGLGVKPIIVTMDSLHQATAHYVLPRPWLELLFSGENIKIIVALVGIAITSASIGTAWVRAHRRRTTAKVLSKEIDEVYSRLKTNPEKCEEELCRLKNTILEGLLFDGKITEASHNIMGKKIEGYLEELRKQKRRKKTSE